MFFPINNYLKGINRNLPKWTNMLMGSMETLKVLCLIDFLKGTFRNLRNFQCMIELYKINNELVPPIMNSILNIDKCYLQF